MRFRAEVIVTRLMRRSLGQSQADPIRLVTQMWSRDGTLVCEMDPFGEPVATWHDEGLEALQRQEAPA